MKKQFLLSFLVLIFVGTFFCGCSEISNVTTIYTDGSRAYYYQINVDKTACETYNIDANAVMNKIQSLSVDYDNKLQQYAILNNRPTEGVEFRYGKSKTNDYIYEIYFTFASFKNYCDFYGITEEDVKKQTEEQEIRNNLFTSQLVIYDSKNESTQDLFNAMSVYIDFTSLVQSFADDFFGGNVETCYQFLDKIKLNIIKCYSTDSKIRSNANSITRTTLPQGLNSTQLYTYTAHLWTCTLSNPTPEIYIYKNVLTTENRVAWYCLALVITVIFGIILWIAIRIYHSSHNTQTTASPIENLNQEISIEKSSENTEKIEKNNQEDL